MMKSQLKKAKSTFESILLSYPKKVQCNICNWEGRHFLSDSWHKHVICPGCHSQIRQRLFFAALQNTDDLSIKRVIDNKKVLHFAAEDVVRLNLCSRAAHYLSADYLREGFDLKLDITDMAEVEDGAFDVVIAFDVLEHVPDYHKALHEIHRVLSPTGFGVFTVPQKDNLLTTYEDPSIVTPEDRTKYFGQHDHLRIFGEDFSEILTSAGFLLKVVDESTFPKDQVGRNVLFPPALSTQPLATNFRKVFFCQKVD